MSQAASHLLNRRLYAPEIVTQACWPVEAAIAEAVRGPMAIYHSNDVAKGIDHSLTPRIYRRFDMFRTHRVRIVIEIQREINWLKLEYVYSLMTRRI